MFLAVISHFTSNFIARECNERSNNTLCCRSRQKSGGKRELAEAHKELPEHKLKIEYPTRLESRQAMVQSVLEPAISLSSKRKARHLVPTWQDAEVLEAINNSLSSLTNFTDATTRWSASLPPFETSFVAVQEDDLDLTRSIKSKILGYLQEKYCDPNR